MNRDFKYGYASFLPKYPQDVLEKCRNIRPEEMEYTNENGYSVKIVKDPTILFCMERIS